MSISDNMTTWAGKPIVDWTDAVNVDDPTGTAYKITVVYEGVPTDNWTDIFDAFLEEPLSDQVTTFVVGNWDQEFDQKESTPVIAALVAAADRLPNLTALFIGDITSEENEISWIRHCDFSQLFAAYPNLVHFGVRGSEDLRLGLTHMPHLKTLTIESGGLPASILAEVFAADLPALRHLELWLGDDNYGGDSSLEDLAPVLGEYARQKWPLLRYLGLRNCEYADDIALALPQAAILRQLEVLDLSLGTLGDIGAEALIANHDITLLKKLDIHHHYVTPEVVAKLEQLPIEVDAADVQTPHVYNGESSRYVAVSE